MPGRVRKESEGILSTKLNPPLVRSDIVNRPQLLAQLEQDIRRPLTLISAPAGYGKSTLAAQWLEAGSLPGVWISLDEGDNNARTFLSYVVAAVRRLESKACTRIFAPAVQPRPVQPAAKQAEEALIEGLTNRETDVLALLCERLYDKEIADRLAISTATVKTRLTRSYGKLGVANRREAARMAKQLGLV